MSAGQIAGQGRRRETVFDRRMNRHPHPPETSNDAQGAVLNDIPADLEHQSRDCRIQIEGLGHEIVTVSDRAASLQSCSRLEVCAKSQGGVDQYWRRPAATCCDMRRAVYS